MTRRSSLPELLREPFHATVERLKHVHGRPVAVGIAEEDEPDVVQVLPVPGRARTRGALPDHLDLAGLHPPLDKLGTRRANVLDHQLQALERAWRHVYEAFAH